MKVPANLPVSASGVWLALCAAAACCVSAFGAPTSLPAADRLAFANNLARRGLHAEALKEYEALKKESSANLDEVTFRIGEAHRIGENSSAAVAAYSEVIAKWPASKWIDYARLNRALLTKGKEREKDLVSLDRATAPLAVRQNALYHLAADAQDGRHSSAAVAFYERAAKLCATNEVGRVSTLRSAAILSASDDPAERRRAMAAYYDLSFAPDARLAEEASYFAVVLCYREKRYAEAFALYRRFADKFPAGARVRSAQIYAAWSAHLANKPEDALKLALAVAEREPNNEDAAYLRAASLQRLERRDEALAAFRAARSRFPSGKYADAEWSAMLSLLAASGDSAAVLSELDAHGTIASADADRTYVFGYEAAIALTNYPKALSFARRAAESKDAAVASRAQYVQGVLEARAGRGRAAVEIWTRLLAEKPGCAEAADALRARAAEELRLGDYRAARRTLDDYVRRFPSPAAAPEILYWRGVAARGTDDAPEAERLFRSALAAKPSAEFAREAQLELAALLQKRGADRESAAIFAALLSTKAADRLGPASLAWLAETCLAASNAPSALAAAEMLEKRNADASWNQIGAALVGRVRESLGETDAASAAYARALSFKARTDEGARAAYALGRLETAAGKFDSAKAHLSDAVERSAAENLLAVRARAYVALAANEDARGDAAEACRLYLVVSTLFDDPALVPPAMKRAVELLRKAGKNKEADEFAAELKRRYPAAGGR